VRSTVGHLKGSNWLASARSVPSMSPAWTQARRHSSPAGNGRASFARPSPARKRRHALIWSERHLQAQCSSRSSTVGIVSPVASRQGRSQTPCAVQVPHVRVQDTFHEPGKCGVIEVWGPSARSCRACLKPWVPSM
jgi:hypothetical protein